MSNIGDFSEKFSSSEGVKEGEKSLPASPIDERVTALFTATLLASPAEPSAIIGKASTALVESAKGPAAKTTYAAAGAGLTASPAKIAPIKRMTYQGMNMRSARIYRGDTFDVAYIPGKSLSASIDPGVQRLAAKDIPLPFPFNTEAFEKAKREMGAVLADPLEKRVFAKVMDALQHITFDDLTSGLRDIIPQFNEAIGDTPFSAVVINSKSNEWVTQIALHEGLKTPDKLSRLEHEDDDIPLTYFGAVAIIDDGSYSGGQISELVERIAKASKTAGGSHPPVTKFFILVPFMTKQAENAIQKAAAENAVEAVIISSGTMLNFSEVLNEEEVACFKKLAYPPHEREFGPTLAFTDWRRPDEYSAPTYLLGGTMYYTSADGTSAIYKGPPLVPAILGPYKLSEE